MIAQSSEGPVSPQNVGMDKPTTANLIKHALSAPLEFLQLLTIPEPLDPELPCPAHAACIWACQSLTLTHDVQACTDAPGPLMLLRNSVQGMVSKCESLQ